MKRCPQCEFIYEDDQSLCDMDGVLLVFDSRALPDLHALTTVPPKAQSKRNRAVPAFASLILALVLGMVYYVSTYRKTAQRTYTPPASAASLVNAVPVEKPRPEAKPSESVQPAEVVEEPKSASRLTIAPTAKRPTAAKAISSSTQIKTTTAPKKDESKKDESKVSSILKKTGRILKKPFKF